MQQHFEGLMQNKGDLPKYRALSNNCADYLVDVINEATDFNIPNHIGYPADLGQTLYDSGNVKSVYSGYEKDFKFNKIENKSSSYYGLIRNTKNERNSAYGYKTWFEKVANLFKK